MSEPAAFAIIRDGQTRCYSDDWANLYLHRDLVWGPEALERWVETLVELEEWSIETDASAVMDTDKRRLMIYMPEVLGVPKVDALYQRLLAAAWPGYAITWAATSHELNVALGLDEPWEEEALALLEDRPATVRDAAGLDVDLDDDGYVEDQDDPEDEFNDYKSRRLAKQGAGHPDATYDAHTDPDQDASRAEVASDFASDQDRAWVTIVDDQGMITHRQLTELPRDLLQCKPSAIEQLAALPPCDVPPERVVMEGMWIDLSQRSVGIWGNIKMQVMLPEIELSWQGWDVQWAPRGYTQQCDTTGPVGEQLSIEEALGDFVPELLASERADPKLIFNYLGNTIKKTAIKATGCLVFVLCLPVLIFGAVTGYWTGVLITVAITVGLAMLAFKMTEWAIRSRFMASMSELQGDEAVGPPSAGPLDPAERRKTLDQLLSAARLPSLSQIEPHFVKRNALGIPD